MTGPGIAVRPIAGALGAEIAGVDLSQPLDDEAFGAIREAFRAHLVLFFRDQRLTPDHHLAFARRFGPLDVHRYAKGLDGYPEVLPVIKEAEDRAGNFGGLWHTDVTFYETPPLGAALYAIQTPAYGGDTLFSNLYLAYETLSDGMKRMLDGMTAVHSGVRTYGRADSRTTERQGGGSRSMQIRVGADAETAVEHPVVRTHPETGRKALFVNAIHVLRFAGWTEDESRPLLDFLNAHAVRPEFTCRFRWRDGSLALWDNRCTQHFALNDYHGQRREMHRVTIAGDRPYFAGARGGATA